MIGAKKPVKTNSSIEIKFYVILYTFFNVGMNFGLRIIVSEILTESSPRA